MFKHNSKRLQTTQAQKQEVSYAQAQIQESSYAQAQNQETSKQTQLHRKMFEVEHLIYNQWCPQIQIRYRLLRL